MSAPRRALVPRIRSWVMESMGMVRTPQLNDIYVALEGFSRRAGEKNAVPTDLWLHAREPSSNSWGR